MHETPQHIVDAQEANRAKVASLGVGFKKVRLDPALHDLLLNKLRANLHKFKSEPGHGFIFSENPNAFPSLIYTDKELNDRLLRDLHGVHEEWSGRTLKPAACYGVRVYQPRSYLYVHLDHANTHVVSSTICVDSRTNKPWPLLIEDDAGELQEVFIEPGEMVFFEGARLRHGRPYPLDGDYYANIFVHYTPVDWSLDA